MRIRKRHCYLCGKVNEDVSVFKFPADSRFHQWLEFCSISVSNYHKGMKLCSEHFPDGCIFSSQKRSTLMGYAIPTLHTELEKTYVHRLNDGKLPVCEQIQMTNKIHRNFINIVDQSQENDLSSQENFDFVDESLDDYPHNSLCVVVTEETSGSVINELKIDESSVMEQSDIKANMSSFETLYEEVPVNEIDSNNLIIRSPEEIFAGKEAPFMSTHMSFSHEAPKKIQTPRNIGDIKISDLDTPLKQHRCLNMIRKRYSTMQKKIALLKRKNRRMTAKLKAVSIFMKGLHRQNLISEKIVNKYSFKKNEQKARS